MDVLPEKVEKLNSYISPIQDEYIEKYLADAKAGVHKLNVTATTDGVSVYTDVDFVIIAASTNYEVAKNYFDTSAVESVIELVLKSSSTATMVFSPQFLRESKTLYDNLYPSCIIVGCDEVCKNKAEIFAKLLVEGA